MSLKLPSNGQATTLNQFEELLTKSHNGDAISQVALIRHITVNNLNYPDIVLKYGEMLIDSVGKTPPKRDFFNYLWRLLFPSPAHDEYEYIVEQVCLAAMHAHVYPLRNRCLQLLEQIHPTSSRVRLLRGRVMENAELYDDAQRVYLQIIQENPSNQLVMKAKQRIIAIHLALNNNFNAIRLLVDFTSVYIDNLPAWFELYKQYAALGRYEEAALCAEKLIIYEPTNHQHHLLVASALYSIAMKHLSQYYYAKDTQLSPVANKQKKRVVFVKPPHVKHLESDHINNNNNDGDDDDDDDGNGNDDGEAVDVGDHTNSDPNQTKVAPTATTTTTTTTTTTASPSAKHSQKKRGKHHIGKNDHHKQSGKHSNHHKDNDNKVKNNNNNNEKNSVNTPTTLPNHVGHPSPTTTPTNDDLWNLHFYQASFHIKHRHTPTYRLLLAIDIFPKSRWHYLQAHSLCPTKESALGIITTSTKLQLIRRLLPDDVLKALDEYNESKCDTNQSIPGENSHNDSKDSQLSQSKDEKNEPSSSLPLPIPPSTPDDDMKWIKYASSWLIDTAKTTNTDDIRKIKAVQKGFTIRASFGHDDMVDYYKTLQLD